MCLWEPVLILLDEEQCLKIVGLAALYESTTLHPKTLRSRFSGESRKSGGPCKPDTDCMAYLTLRAFVIISIVCESSLYRMVSRRGLFKALSVGVRGKSCRNHPTYAASIVV